MLRLFFYKTGTGHYRKGYNMDYKTPAAPTSTGAVTEKAASSVGASGIGASKAGKDAGNGKKPKKEKKAKGKNRDEGLTEEEKQLRAEQRKRAARKKRKKIIKTLIIVLILVAIAAFALWKFFDIKQREEAANTLVTYTVERRTITEKTRYRRMISFMS